MSVSKVFASVKTGSFLDAEFFVFRDRAFGVEHHKLPRGLHIGLHDRAAADQPKGGINRLRVQATAEIVGVFKGGWHSRFPRMSTD
jgi:hypothetical protein